MSLASHAVTRLNHLYRNMVERGRALPQRAADPLGDREACCVEPLEPRLLLSGNQPTLTDIATLGGGTEDTAYTITYDALAAAGNEADGEGDPISFRVEGLSNGTLTKDGQPVVPGTTLIGAGESVEWTPPADAWRTTPAFTVKAWDGTSASASPVQVRVELAGTQDDPTVATALDDVNVSAGSADVAVALPGHFADADVTGPIYQFTSSHGNFYVHMLADRAPATVANFSAYADADLYDGTFIHRMMPGFVAQGGGYTFPNNALVSVPDFDPVVNEPGVSNIRGTVAMAKIGGDPDSATNEFFFSLADNSANLDYQNGGFTVFGEVLTDGMDVLDTMAALPIWNAGGAFENLPLDNFDNTGPIAYENLVAFHDISQVSPFAYEVVGNTNPNLVTPTVNAQNELVLDFAEGNFGEAELTVRATDIEGNAVETTMTVNVAAGPLPNLAGVFRQATLPQAVVVGQPIKGKVQVQILNDGDVALPKTQTVDVNLVAVPQGGGDEVVIGQLLGYRVGNLAPGKARNANIAVNLPNGLAAGTFDLEARITPVDPLTEKSTADNTATGDADSNGITITSAAAFVDPAAALGNMRAPTAVTSGDGTKITVPVEITNNGNVPMGDDVEVAVQVFIRPVGAADDSGDILIGEATNQSLKKLAPGRAKKVTVQCLIPPGVATDNYQIVTEIDTGDVVAQGAGDDPANNTAIDAQAISVTFGFVDPVTGFGKMNMPTVVLANQLLRGTVQVLVTNQGNVPLPNGQTADVQLFLQETGTQNRTLIGEALGQKISKLAPGKAKGVNVKVNMPNGVPADGYDLVAVVTPLNGLNETDTANNTATQNSALESRRLAPDAIAGMHWTAKVSDGTGDFGDRGSYELLFASAANVYGRIGDGVNHGPGTGTYTYTRTGDNTGIVTYVDSEVGPGWSSTLTFTSLTQADFRLDDVGGDFQTGTMTFDTTGAVAAPATVTGNTYNAKIKRGQDPFDRRGTYEVAFAGAGNTYDVNGSTNGTYTYYPAANGWGLALLEDGDLGTTVLLMDFTSATQCNYDLGSIDWYAQQSGSMTQV